MLVISQRDILAAVTIQDAIAAARTAFLALAAGKSVVPLRPHVATTHGTSLFMPAWDPTLPTVGVKVVTVTQSNAARGIPTVQAVVVLADEATGTATALLAGTFLTQLRTGAAMGLAADLLAGPESATVALFGAGATARISLWAVCSVRAIREVRVVHPHAERFPAFVTAMGDFLGDDCPPLRRVESPSDAMRGAEIILTATTSTTPLFPGEAIEPGAFVGALGAYTAAMREVDTVAIKRARVVVDTIDGALHEAGDLVIPIEAGDLSRDHIWAELGQIASGERPGRTSADEIFIFKSVGNAMQDLALATRVYDKALALGLGTSVEL